MLVVDASALVAIGMAEPGWRDFAGIIDGADAAVISSINLTEAGLVLVLRHGLFDLDRFGRWIERLNIAEVDVSGLEALDAYLRYGKGVHRAGLNMGDCYAYALAKRLDAPLLYKGNDFARTDIKAAYQPT